MSVPVLFAAGGYEMLDVIQMTDLGEFLPLLAVGLSLQRLWAGLRSNG
jgi:hypothetical protein